MKPLQFKVLLTFDRTVMVWVARGINYDIAAQGATIAEAKTAFERVAIAQLIVDLEDGKEPFQDCPPAPAHVEALFEAALQMKEEQRFEIPADLPIPPAYQIDAQLRDMRISA